MEIIEEEVKSYELVYEDVHRSGYSFPCDKEGNILWKELLSPDAVQESLAYCKAHPEKWTGKNGKIVTLVSHERYGICPHCGRRIDFCGSGYMGAFECACGQWYNMFGQELLPPEDWAEPWEEPREEDEF